jgi:hypothetical protein
MVFPSLVDLPTMNPDSLDGVICLTNNCKKSKIISKSTLELVDWMLAADLTLPKFQLSQTFFF